MGTPRVLCRAVQVIVNDINQNGTQEQKDCCQRVITAHLNTMDSLAWVYSDLKEGTCVRVAQERAQETLAWSLKAIMDVMDRTQANHVRGE